MKRFHGGSEKVGWQGKLTLKEFYLVSGDDFSKENTFSHLGMRDLNTTGMADFATLICGSRDLATPSMVTRVLIRMVAD